jgi:hypothetical protein
MNLPDELLECLHIKKVEMCVEVNSFQDEMKAYLVLCLEGKSSIPKRKIMLANHRKDLELKMQELQAAIDYLDWKQSFYDDVLSGKIKYYSNLTNVDGEK